MPNTDARKRADAKYKREKTTQLSIRFYNTTERELIDHLQAQPNKAGYIKRLIKQDMGRSAPHT